MKSGKLISAGYSMPLYDIPIFKKYKPKGGCKNTEEIIKKSLWMDIHKFRTQDEISEELDLDSRMYFGIFGVDVKLRLRFVEPRHRKYLKYHKENRFQHWLK